MSLEALVNQSLSADWAKRRIARRKLEEALAQQSPRREVVIPKPPELLEFNLPDEPRYFQTYALERCPFCHCEARLYRVKRGTLLYAVRCGNVLCGQSRDYIEPHQWLRSSREAVTAWQLFCKLAQ